MSHNIVVLAGHSDDEVLGVGGTIARHSEMGDKVHVVVAAEGITSRDPARDLKLRKTELDQLRKTTERAAKDLRVSEVRFLGFSDNRCDSVDRLEIVKKVEKIIAELRPEIVYVHHGGDVNIDHRRLHEAAFTACRPQPGQPVTRLLSFETASSTEWAPPGSLPSFQPTVFVDIAQFWEQKLAALKTYHREMRPWPHARSIEAVQHLAKWRGASVGLEMAEAFVLMREIVK
jgi:LmbE family N-acetylglucosaminyl deacetylase